MCVSVTLYNTLPSHFRLHNPSKRLNDSTEKVNDTNLQILYDITCILMAFGEREMTPQLFLDGKNKESERFKKINQFTTELQWNESLKSPTAFVPSAEPVQQLGPCPVWKHNLSNFNRKVILLLGQCDMQYSEIIIPAQQIYCSCEKQSIHIHIYIYVYLWKC